MIKYCETTKDQKSIKIDRKIIKPLYIYIYIYTYTYIYIYNYIKHIQSIEVYGNTQNIYIYIYKYIEKYANIWKQIETYLKICNFIQIHRTY